MRVLAIIPARGGSKRLPGKNIRPLHGRPLIQWSIDFARSVEWFTSVEVSTDSTDIVQCCATAGQTVARLRPGNLATDEASSVDVALDVLNWKVSQGQEFDLIALLQPTTPVRAREHWDEALRLLGGAKHDAVVGVGPAQSHPHLTFRMGQSRQLEPWIAERPVSLRAQDLEPALVVNGSLYLIRTSVLQREKTFMPQLTAGVDMNAPLENLDIDTEFDWLVAEKAIEYFRGRQ
jgi:CMP-N,N'-diacetyllegionaminic acid synthase